MAEPKKKLRLEELKVDSFVTSVEMDVTKGGTFGCGIAIKSLMSQCPFGCPVSEVVSTCPDGVVCTFPIGDPRNPNDTRLPPVDVGPNNFPGAFPNSVPLQNCGSGAGTAPPRHPAFTNIGIDCDVNGMPL